MCVIVISHVAEIIKFQVTSAEQTNTKFIVSPRHHIKNGPNPRPLYRCPFYKIVPRLQFYFETHLQILFSFFAAFCFVCSPKSLKSASGLS